MALSGLGPGVSQGAHGGRSMAARWGLLAMCLLGTAMAAGAQGTRVWSQSSPEDWERGTPHGVAIGSGGELTPTGVAHDLGSIGSTFAWGVAAGPAGEAYVATSAPAGVLRVDSAGKQTHLFSTKDLAVQVIKRGPDGALYVATAPSGAVYRLDGKGTGEVDAAKLTPVFDTKSVDGKPKYIWDLSWDKAGRLYVATGAPGGVYRVAAGGSGGKAELWFQTDEPHVRALAWGAGGELYAGTDGSGLVYRVSPEGKGFVLYEAGKREITALALDGTHLWLAAVGEKGRSSLPPLTVTGQAVVTTTITLVQAAGAGVPAGTPGGSASVSDGSELDLLDTTGGAPPRTILNAHDEVVYALEPLPGGAVLAAAGNNGHLLRVQSSGEVADIGHLAAQQVTALAPAQTGGGWWAVTANPGKVFRVDATPAAESVYESEVFDARVSSRWGRVDALGRGSYELWARTGNLDNPLRGWAPWVRLGADGEAPPSAGLGTARYAQWRAVLHPGAELSQVAVSFLEQNQAPTVEELQVVPGTRANGGGGGSQPALPQQVLLSFRGGDGAGPALEGENQPLPATRDKGWVTAHWAARDENGDRLHFALWYRREDETGWHLLKDKLHERFYTWEAALLPDGPYRLKVVASDSESHPPGQGLEAERESAVFRIATASPRVENLAAALAPGRELRVSATATSPATPIVRAEYAVDAGEWRWVEPVGSVSDSSVEHYQFTVPDVGPGTHSVTLRVWDRFENEGSAETATR